MPWKKERHIYKEKSPCKDCSERHLGCHSTCEKYIDFKERVEEERKAKTKFYYANEHYYLHRDAQNTAAARMLKLPMKSTWPD